MFAMASVGDSTGANEVVGPSNALYVDVAGNNATGTRGNAALPFLTIQAALDAMNDEDEILIGPGTFAYAAALHTSVGIKKFTIHGSGIQTTFLIPDAGVDGIDFSTVGAVAASINDFAIVCSTGGNCLSAVGTATGFYSTGLICERVSLTAGDAGKNAVDFSLFGVCTFLDCVIPTGSMLFQLTSRITFRGTSLTGTSTIFDWNDDAATKPVGGQMFVRVLEGSELLCAVTLTGQPILQVDQSSQMTSLTGNVMSVAASLAAPAISYRGAISTIDFQSAAAKYLPDAAPVGSYVVDFATAIITGSSAKFRTSVTALTVIMTGIQALSSAFILTADEFINVIARGAVIRSTTISAVYATPGATGSIVPPFLKGTNDISAGGVLVRTWANLGYTNLVRVGTAVFNAQVQAAVQGSDPVVPTAGKLVTGLSITATAQVANVADVFVQF